ncbi:MAG: hypothetical protein ABI040_08010 [Rhodoferax sp.]
MWNSAYLKPDKVVMRGSFYCLIDPATGQVCLTIKAASLPRAMQRMKTLAPLIGVKPAGDPSYVVLEEAPHGVPLYFDGATAIEPVQHPVASNGCLTGATGNTGMRGSPNGSTGEAVSPAQ